MQRPGARIVGGVTDIIWSPTSEYIERSNVTRFMRAHGIETPEELVERSVADVAWFWDAVVHDLDIGFLEPYEQVLDIARGVEWATWFGGGRLNLAHQCVDRWAVATPEAPAVVWEGEDGAVRTWSYADLRRECDRLAAELEAATGIRGAGADYRARAEAVHPRGRRRLVDEVRHQRIVDVGLLARSPQHVEAAVAHDRGHPRRGRTLGPRVVGRVIPDVDETVLQDFLRERPLPDYT